MAFNAYAHTSESILARRGSSDMAALGRIPGIEAFIKHRVETQFKSHKDVSEELKRLYPGMGRGVSYMSVRRFCTEHNIHKTARITDHCLDRLVSQNFLKVSLIIAL